MILIVMTSVIKELYGTKMNCSLKETQMPKLLYGSP